MSAKQKAGPTAETGPHNSTPVDHDYTRHQAEALSAVTGYALAVETGAGRYRRRMFLTLAAAENAVARARARGQYAEVILVRVVPVEVIS